MTERADITIVRAGAERIDELVDLYAALHEYHVSLAPDLAGRHGRTAAESWRRRRARYIEWLACPDAFLLLAESRGKLLGYAVVSPGPGMQSWESQERIADVHDIAVLPTHRRSGIGSQLLRATRDAARERGIGELRLMVIEANDDARRFYERQGLAVASHVMLDRL
jgi:ribosomal protein S18 acetylase RimI-like enzyme